MNSGKVVVLSAKGNRNVLLNQEIFDAYSVWSKITFRCLNDEELFENASTSLIVRLSIIGVGDKLNSEYTKFMMHQVCVANWPQFTTMCLDLAKQGKKLTATQFLINHASQLEVNSNSMLLLGYANKKRSRGNCIGNAYKKVRSFEPSEEYTE